MSATTRDTMQAAFLRVRDQGDITDWVRAARPAARAIVREGMDTDPLTLVARLAGDLERAPRSYAVTFDSFATHVVAALSLCIAIGQMVHPDAFEKGGA